MRSKLDYIRLWISYNLLWYVWKSAIKSGNKTNCAQVWAKAMCGPNHFFQLIFNSLHCSDIIYGIRIKCIPLLGVPDECLNGIRYYWLRTRQSWTMALVMWILVPRWQQRAVLSQYKTCSVDFWCSRISYNVNYDKCLRDDRVWVVEFCECIRWWFEVVF